MENKIYSMKDIKEELKGNDGLEYEIIYSTEDYCLLYAGDKFYYMQTEYFGGVTVTLYNKIDANTKRQAGYPRKIANFNDLLNYIAGTKKEYFKCLDETYNQTIFYQLKIIENGETLEKYLSKISGYREKYVLDNLDYIKEVEKRKDYHTLEFVDKEGNYFLINCKDRNRLIVG